MWSSVSLLAASLSYQVSSYPDLYDSVQCEKFCAKLLTLSLVTQCCVLSRDLCSLGIDLYFVRMVFSFQELGASAAKETCRNLSFMDSSLTRDSRDWLIHFLMNTRLKLRAREK